MVTTRHPFTDDFNSPFGLYLAVVDLCVCVCVLVCVCVCVQCVCATCVGVCWRLCALKKIFLHVKCLFEHPSKGMCFRMRGCVFACP